MVTPISDSPLAILTFIAAPAVFTNAASVLALGTGNRLARVVDRTRQLADELRKDSTDTPLNEMYLRQLGRLEKRADRLVRGMTFFYMAVGAFAAASLVAVFGASLASTSHGLPFQLIAFFSLGAGIVGFVGLSTGSVLLVQETRLAVVTLREEARIVKEEISPALRKSDSASESQ
ncbi:MAG TPA: DUF2721 domain-containing protein [Terriglobales bacterium]|jgi:hypothetical protein|nr:DUF2721 domain-containing protein [Terriglobales bacterium]